MTRSPKPPRFETPRIRGSALVLVMVLIFALSILVISMGRGLTMTINSNDRVAAESEMVQTAIGFVHILRANMSDGELSEEMKAYDMVSGRDRYEVHAAWDDTRGSSIFHTFRLEEQEDDPALDEDEARITVRAERQRGSRNFSRDVSVISLTVRSPPHNAYYGNNVVIGDGLTTNTPLGTLGDVYGLDPDDPALVFHGDDVFVAGEYHNWELAEGDGLVHENANVPGLEFDVGEMVAEKEQEWADGGYNQIAPGEEIRDPYTGETVRVPDDGDKAVWLKFDESEPNHVTLATTQSARQSVANPYSDETVQWPVTYTEDGEAVIHISEFRDVAVEGTYSNDITIVADEGTLQIVGDLEGSSEDTAPIGLIAAGHGNETGSEAEHEGNVYVRGMRNSQDYGFAEDSDGVVNAHIYSAGIISHFHPTGTMDTLEFNAKIMAMGEGASEDPEDGNWRTTNTDFYNVAHNRHFWEPINDAYPPGMDPDHINVINMPPQIKSGSWSIGRINSAAID